MNLSYQLSRSSRNSSLSLTRRVASLRTQTAIPDIFSSLQGPPIARLVPPGHCQFTPEFQPVQLVARQAISSTSSILRFALPDSNQPLQLSTCACVLAGAMIDGIHVVRPYTPISTNALVGHVDFLIKSYDNFDQKGTMSRYLHQVDIGSTDISFRHIAPNVKIQAPFSQKHIIMLAGGTGIAPMLQALHAILGSKTTTAAPSSSPLIQRSTHHQPKVTLLYGSQNSQDILGESILERWSRDYSNRFQLVHVLSDEPPFTSSWTGKRGFIDSELIAEHVTSSLGEGFHEEDVLILVCGPPPMYQALCGPREESHTVGGILGEMGFTRDQVYKF
jgi:cytochrome-b5 reductase